MERTENPVKHALRGGGTSFGAWMQFGHPGIAEVFATAGFPWIAVDMEHSDIGIAEFTACARGMHGRGAVPLARVRENDTLAIRQALDAGAGGVIVPLVENAADAERAVASALYPPRGVRGSAFMRANDYGTRFDEYAAWANRDTLVILMVESRRAVENLGEILAVDGVDGLFIGPYDLSASYGIPGQLGHPLMREARGKVLEACGRTGKAAGIHLVRFQPVDVEAAVREGFRFIALGMDNIFLQEGAKAALLAARAAAAVDPRAGAADPGRT